MAGRTRWRSLPCPAAQSLLGVLQESGGRLTLHISLDEGATRQHIPLSDEQVIPATLGGLG